MNDRKDRIIFMKKKNIVFALCLIFALGFLFMPQGGRNAEAASRTRLSSTSLLRLFQGRQRNLGFMEEEAVKEYGRVAGPELSR